MALVTVERTQADETERSDNKEETDGRNTSTVQRSVSECYFVVKGAAIVLPHDECMHVYRKARTSGGTDIQQHLQSMLYLLRPNDILRMAVKLESVHTHRMRYLVVVSCTGRQLTEESCLLGIDCNSKTTIGLVLPVWADTQITLDGDGGFSVSSSGRHHIFKPVSVQAMWSALQTLHKASEKARKYTYYMGGGTHHWIENYEKRIESDRSCLNEWHAMDDLVSRRPPSPDTTRSEPSERETAEKQIRTKLKELMMSVDLDEVTSKYIRIKLEEQLDLNLNEYKSFIDQEMLTILGQMDAPTEIFEYLYLGSEWNASNLEELKYNKVGHILNVTREIDNFFPGMFEYSNIRVYDDETTEMLQYWDKTYKYIAKVKDEGSKVLVHCKMGISRSASVVIAYVMKAYDWNLDKALDFVKNKRNCIKPNSGFLKQLEIYQGILDASKQRHNTLWRSKSETNLKSPEKPKKGKRKEEKRMGNAKQEECSYLMLPGCTARPKSWSPDDATADILLSLHTVPIESNMDFSNETEKMEGQAEKFDYSSDHIAYSGTEVKDVDLMAVDEEMMSSPKSDTDISDIILCSENNTVTLDVDTGLPRVSSIKDRINKLESQANTLPEAQKSSKHETSSKSGLVLNLANQFECGGSKPGTPSPVDEGLTMKTIVDSLEQDVQGVDPVISQMKPPIPKHHAVLIKPPPWPSEASDKPSQSSCLDNNISDVSGHQHNKPFLQTIKQIPSIQSDFTSKIAGKVTPSMHPDAERKSSQIENSSASVSHKSSSSPMCTATEANSCTQVSQHEIVLQVSVPPSHSSKEIVMKQNLADCADEHTVETSKTSVWRCIDNGSSPIPDSCIMTPTVKQSQKFPTQTSMKCLGIEDAAPKSIENNNSEASHNYVTHKSFEASQTFPADNCVIQSEIYDKESIPWTPGTVLRTKQQLEEQNVKKACDSNYPVLSHSTPSTPPEMCPEVDSSISKLVQRSNSLRSEHRPSSMYGNKWYPLPALAGPMPFKSPKERLSSSSSESNSRTEIVHSVSTPSVVDAVNDVLCGTQEILTSAIQSLPLERQRNSPSELSSPVIKSEPDSEALLPFTECISFNSTNKRQEHGAGDNPLPGTVKQQKEFLENLHTKSTPIKEPFDDSKTNKEQMRLIKEYGKSLVIATPSSELEEKDFGKVKRLTKELEAKSGSLANKKDRIVIVNKDGEEIDGSEHSTNILSPSVIDCRSRLCTGGDLVVQSKVTLINKDRNHTNNITEKGHLSDEKIQQPPPTPHRKTSLDLECLKKTHTSQPNHLCNQTIPPSSGPLFETLANIKNIRTLPRSLSSNGLQKVSLLQISQQKLTRTTSSENLFNVQPVKTSLPSGKTTMLLKSPPAYTIVSPPPPPPPPPGPPRKVRKQQGKTHPLTKLTVKQRHANPLYNTM